MDQCFRVCLKVEVEDSSNSCSFGSGRLDKLDFGVICRMRLVPTDIASDKMCPFFDFLDI